jgi:hypothetical protein
MNRLNSYFEEAYRHKSHILEAKEELYLPIKDYDNLSKLEKFALNTLIFRFSKLQDLMGSKIFREYLNYSGLAINDFGFFDILKELEKQSILDIDSWQDLRELRNDIAHDYPNELEEKLEKINLFVNKSNELIVILEQLERKYHEIKR